MAIAIISGLNYERGYLEPIKVVGANTEDSFFTDAPSITAINGFVYALGERETLKQSGVGILKKGITINGFSVLLHDFERYGCNKGYFYKGYNSSAHAYQNEKDLMNPPRPIETVTATMAVSIVIEYEGRLPTKDVLLDDINNTTLKLAGGTIQNDVMITDVSDETFSAFCRKNRAYQVTDRADLNITSWEQILEYVSATENPETKKFERKHSGLFYAHQTGIQLLEEPSFKKGVIIGDEEVYKHAYCDPIINLAELKAVNAAEGTRQLSMWKRVCDETTNTITLTTNY